MYSNVCIRVRQHVLQHCSRLHIAIMTRRKMNKLPMFHIFRMEIEVLWSSIRRLAEIACDGRLRCNRVPDICDSDGCRNKRFRFPIWSVINNDILSAFTASQLDWDYGEQQRGDNMSASSRLLPSPIT